jgi:hypothetical protein
MKIKRLKELSCHSESDVEKLTALLSSRRAFGETLTETRGTAPTPLALRRSGIRGHVFAIDEFRAGS